MTDSFDELISLAEELKQVKLEFESNIRLALRGELMKLAEQKIDLIVDETVKRLQTKVDGTLDAMRMQRVVQFTVRRIGEYSPKAE